MLASICDAVSLHIPGFLDIKVPDIPPVTNFSKMSGYNNSAPPKYQHLHHNAIIQN